MRRRWRHRLRRGLPSPARLLSVVRGCRPCQANSVKVRYGPPRPGSGPLMEPHSGVHSKPPRAWPTALRHNRLTMSEEERVRAATTPQPRHVGLGLGPDKLRTIYRQMVMARALDRRMWVLNRQGKAPFAISGQGPQAAPVLAPPA